MKRKWFGLLLPILLGLLLAALVNAFSPINPVIYMRASMSVLIFFVGVLVSAVLSFFVWKQSHNRQSEQAIANAQQKRYHQLCNGVAPSFVLIIRTRLPGKTWYFPGGFLVLT